MKKAQWISLVASAACFVAGTVAHAEGFYFGISGGVSSVDLPSKSSFDEFSRDVAQEIADMVGVNVGSFDSSLDDSGKVWGLQVGYRWNRYVAAEVGYIDLGQVKYSAAADFTDGDDVPLFSGQYSARVRSHGPTIAAVGFLPLGDRVDLHAKAGVYFSDTRFREKLRLFDSETEESVQEEVKDSTQDLFVGIGAAWNIGDNYALRVEYQRFFDVGDDDTDEADVDVFSLSILFR